MPTSALLASYGGSSGDITTGLIDWYKFDEGSGSSAANSGSSGFGLSFFGGIWATGIVGPYALQGPYGGGAISSAVPDLTGPNFFGMWYKIDSEDTNGRVISFWDSVNSYRMMVVKNHSASGEIAVVSSDGSAYYVSSIDSGWHHIMGAYTDGALSEAYFDNVLMTNTYGSSTFGADSVGGRCFDAKNNGANVTSSYKDDFRRFTRLLNATDRAALYAYR